MSQAHLLPTVDLVEGRPVVSSLKIAEHFEKQHFQVLRDIRELSKDIPDDLRESIFVCSQYEGKTPSGGARTYPMFLLTRDGFTLIAMGFTGKKALAWKIKYIQAFNAMEKALCEMSNPKPKPKALGRGIKALPAHDPVAEEINSLLKKVEFYTREVDSVGEQIARIMAQESIKKMPDGKFGDPDYDFHSHTATSVRFLFSSISFSLNAVRDTIKIRRAHGI